MLFGRHDSRSGGRPGRQAIICDAAKANENVCADGVDLDRALNGALSPSGFDSNLYGSVFPVCLGSPFWAPSNDGRSEVFQCCVLVHPALTGYDAKSSGEDRREEEERRHALEQFQGKQSRTR
jgi:hypothetical protein